MFQVIKLAEPAIGITKGIERGKEFVSIKERDILRMICTENTICTIPAIFDRDGLLLVNNEIVITL